MGDHPLLLEWHGSATVSRSVSEFVEGFLEGISPLLETVEAERAFQSVTVLERNEHNTAPIIIGTENGQRRDTDYCVNDITAHVSLKPDHTA